MLPIFVINLDRRPDRLTSITAQLESLGLEARRIPAVDAETYDLEDDPSLSFRGRMLSRRFDRGSGACLLSHFEAMRAVASSGAEAGLILEDDVTLSSQLPLFIGSIEWWPEKAAVLKLEAPYGQTSRHLPVLGRPETAYCGRELRRIKLWCWGSGAYLIRAQAATDILREYQSISIPIDNFLFDMRTSRTARKLRPFIVSPALAYHPLDGMESDVHHWIKATKRHSFYQRRLRDVAVAPFKVSARVQRLIGSAEQMSVPFEDRISYRDGQSTS